MVFLSAKGGTGTSTLCANLATYIQQTNTESRVVVADLVLPIGSMGSIVGEEGPTWSASHCHIDKNGLRVSAGPGRRCWEDLYPAKPRR
jgi:MinD superfamily P-loop ATPase